MLVDTHAHLMDLAFADDLPEVLHRAAVAGVGAMICVGYDVASSVAAVRLAESHPQILAAVGIHPNSSGAVGPRAFDEVRRLAGHPRVVGIGETGLDRFRKRTPIDVQRDWFARHLDLAAELGLPVIVHNRQADEDTATMLSAWAAELDVSGLPGARAPGTRPSPPVRGVLHCFAGDVTMLQAGLRAGFMVSIAGPVTYRNARELPDRVREVPLDHLVVETDCPYLPPTPYRGKRNEPAYVRLTAERVAEIHGLPLAEIERTTTANARRLFPALTDLAELSAPMS
ncbi:MAG: TatD family hydrolase [Chloroflexota bacterium]|nr:TatD family hydrolase [Chloroflexota bacterium]